MVVNIVHPDWVKHVGAKKPALYYPTLFCETFVVRRLGDVAAGKQTAEMSRSFTTPQDLRRPSALLP